MAGGRRPIARGAARGHLGSLLGPALGRLGKAGEVGRRVAGSMSAPGFVGVSAHLEAKCTKTDVNLNMVF